MLLTFQFPIIDFRSLIDNNYRIPVPNWPKPRIGSMIKNFGSVQIRLNGGSSYWSGEQRFCSSENAIKFPGLDKKRILFSNGFEMLTEGAYRRVYSTNNFLVKCEVGLINRFEKYIEKIITSKDYFDFILKEYCKLNVYIEDQLGKKNDSEICHCGKMISQKYLFSTSYNQAFSVNRKGTINNLTEEWWTTWGEPLLIVEFDDANKDIQLPKNAKRITLEIDKGLELYHCWITVSENKKFRTWIIRKFEDHDSTFARNLRINLLRINAEKEVLNGIIYLLKEKGNSLINTEEKEILIAEYLDKTSTKLLNDVRFGINQANILDVALKAEETANMGDIESFLELLNPLKHKYTINNMKKISDKGFSITVGGNAKFENFNNEYKNVKGGINNNSTTINNNFNFQELNSQLDQLIKKLNEKENKTSDDYKAIAEVVSAKEASCNEDGKKVEVHLKNAGKLEAIGKWILNVAKDIGVPVVVKLLETLII